MRIRFIQNLIDKIRGKKRTPEPDILIKEQTTKNNIDIPPELYPNVILNVQGKNNTIRIPKIKNQNAKIYINIYGNNNEIIIKEGFGLGISLTLQIGQDHRNFGECNNSKFFIDEHTSIESMFYVTYNCNATCEIGKGCMISGNVTLFNTDAHPILDNETGKVINKVKGIEIGNHCWIGMNATILKNSKVPDNSIVGYNAVFTGGGKSPNSIYAGNPARLVKTNINWHHNGSINGYIANEIED